MELASVHNNSQGNSGSSLVPAWLHYLFWNISSNVEEQTRSAPAPSGWEDWKGWKGRCELPKGCSSPQAAHPCQGSSAFLHHKTSSSPQVTFCSRCASCKCQQSFVMKLLSFALFPLCPKMQQSHTQEISFFSGPEKGERPQGKITRN